MIPKIFHIIWLSDDKPSFNSEQINNISTWMYHNPDFKLYIWNTIDYDEPFIKRHKDLKKFAAASDFLRLKILHEYGGIYLDDDVTCYKSFTPLLDNKCFLGVDHTSEELTVINNAIIGAEPGNPFIQELIDHSRKKFDVEVLNYPFGYVIVDLLKTHGFKRGWANLEDQGAEIKTYNDVTIYTGDFFYPGYGANKLNQNTYMRHHYKLRWHDKK